jgi:hypothetical protein
MVEPPSVAYVVEIADTECAVWYESSEAMERMEPVRGSFSVSDGEISGGEAMAEGTAAGGVGVAWGSGDSGVARTVSIEDKDGS